MSGLKGGRTAGRVSLLGVMLLGLTAGAGVGQTLEERVAAVTDGDIRLSFAARDGVCGNGRYITTSGRSRHWDADCDPGPVRVVLEKRAGVLRDVETRVGGRWRPAEGVGRPVSDLGTVSAPDAARLLLRLAESNSGEVGKDAIFPAALADSVTVWPDLLRLARNASLPRETRKGAVFWLGQAAGEAVVDDLGELAAENPDREIQEAAVFALSQVDDGAGIDALLRIARTHSDASIRKTAMFWLGQSGDERAIALFEEILLDR